MKNTLVSALFAAFVVTTAGCTDAPAPPPGAPLPLEAIVGHWEGTNGLEFAVLDITPSGTLSWERKGATKTSLNGASVQNLTTTGFDANLFVNVHFVLNAAPREENGVTNMTLDGIVLTRGPTPATTTAAEPTTAPTVVPGERATPLPPP